MAKERGGVIDQAAAEALLRRYLDERGWRYQHAIHLLYLCCKPTCRSRHDGHAERRCDPRHRRLRRLHIRHHTH